MRDLLLGFSIEKVLEGACSRGRRSALHRKTQREKPFDDSRVDKKIEKSPKRYMFWAFVVCFTLKLFQGFLQIVKDTFHRSHQIGS